MKARRSATALLVALGATACDNPDPEPEPNKPAEGVYAPLGEILPTATAAQRETFLKGRDVAEHRFLPSEGLGPAFNVTFCSACHERPMTGGSSPRYRNFLLVGQSLPDGSFTATGVNGIQVQYEPGGTVRVPDDDDTNVLATRNAIPFFGAGLIAELSSEEIEKRADPEDANGDGISGRVNYDRGFAGRFGRKSQTVSIEGFIRGPLFNHLGLTSNPLSDSRKAQLPVPSVVSGVERNGLVGTIAKGQAAAPDEPNHDEDGVPDPELSEQDLFDLVSFTMLLAAPQAEPLTDRTRLGKKKFEEARCTDCHVEALVSPRGLLPVFSDLLLHDMGPELADGIVMKEASGSEFRTQPLWGLSATGPYLHDGRADTVHEAILAHGGEAEASKGLYEALADDDQKAIEEFLASLGGRSQQSDGLLPPNAPLIAAGEYGGPIAALSGEAQERFRRGRAVFDGNFEIHQGLGPRFNGDSCRACHFDPVIGGSGPNDVNVTRHGIVDSEGVYSDPSIGTMAHKLHIRAERPPIDPNANVFEHRQTPPLFGLGLISRISDETLIALEDPDDSDGDGIRGIARRLPDGRVGRMGWKAGVPNVAEFARDALSNEVGVTLPDTGSPFGFGTDDDDVADPEITEDEIDDLVFFMEELAPPPRKPIDAGVASRGEALFDQVGCSACHIPSLETEDGVTVHLYSDVLLHEVAPEGALGIKDGVANMRMFRTSPLWGISETAPFMHDGRADTVEEAIARHFGEAEASAIAVSELSEDELSDLLAFLGSL